MFAHGNTNITLAGKGSVKKNALIFLLTIK